MNLDAPYLNNRTTVRSVPYSSLTYFEKTITLSHFYSNEVLRTLQDIHRLEDEIATSHDSAAFHIRLCQTSILSLEQDARMLIGNRKVRNQRKQARERSDILKIQQEHKIAESRMVSRIRFLKQHVTSFASLSDKYYRDAQTQLANIIAVEKELDINEALLAIADGSYRMPLATIPEDSPLKSIVDV